MTKAVRRCVHVFATFGAGGPQIRATQLMGRLGPGWTHVVMAMDGRTEARAQLPPGVAAEFVPPPARAGLLATIRRQRQWLLAQRPDLVLTYNWGAIETVAAARWAGLPLVHHEDGFGPEEVARRFARRSWLRWLWLRRVPVIVPSAVLQRIATGEWGLPTAQVHHLPNGVDLVRFAPLGQDPGLAASPRASVGTVGGLRPEKDHATLLQALARLPAATTARIVGGGALADVLAQQAASLGLAPRVAFVGPVADTAPEYGRFRVFVLSSCTEQMPIAMLEAMAAGLPVVATDVGDVRAILPPDAAACVVPARDPAALAAALDRVLADAALRERLGAANRARAVAHYQAAACLDRFLALYRRAAGG